ncbi:hypothetical protein [Leucothrix arctica]|uniref:Uncharacterized protein n=1 Tax=Leucothrix arctica TaxID=1481894 RepID=A0A317CGD1_9GAMM|nr:hypothetical protein [Leucothrix arctica]PWQ95272.1 hypothetical protein DKT75_13085 [Leucothrix arctica]
MKAGALAGAVSGAIMTGSVKGALFGGLSAGIAFKIGAAASLGKFGKSLAHGATQGGVNVLQGGKFRSGFMGGFFGHLSAGLGQSLVGDGRSWGSIMGRTAVSSVVGGTISRVSGGKFANGAITAAFTHLFNAETAKKITWDKLSLAQKRNVVSGVGSDYDRLLKDYGNMTDKEIGALLGINPFEARYRALKGLNRIKMNILNVQIADAFADTASYASDAFALKRTSKVAQGLWGFLSGATGDGHVVARGYIYVDTKHGYIFKAGWGIE